MAKKRRHHRRKARKACVRTGKRVICGTLVKHKTHRRRRKSHRK